MTQDQVTFRDLLTRLHSTSTTGVVNIFSSLDQVNDVFVSISLSLFFFQARPPFQVGEKKEMGVPEVGVSEEGVCCKIIFL